MRDIGIPRVADSNLFRYLSPDIPTLPEICENPGALVIFRTAREIEAERLAQKGLPLPVRDGTHGE